MNSLINMYFNVGASDHAWKLFQTMEHKDIASWNTILSVSSRVAGVELEQVVALFSDFMVTGLKPNRITFSILFKMCGDLGQQLYGLAFRLGLHNDPHISNCLISMFCRCNAKETARSIFDSIPSRSLQNWNEMIHGSLVHGYAKYGFLTDSYAFFDDKMDMVCWGALISALVDQGYTMAAIKHFNHLKQDGQYPDSFILGSILNMCASITSLDLAKSVHGEVFKSGFDTDEYVTSAVIDAYGKSGDIKSASIVFRKSSRFADVVLFNTMIMAYASHSCVTEAMEVYNVMKSVNLSPSQSTFVSVLSACSHAGLVDLGCSLFRSITLDYKMDPSPNNYGCLVDLLSRNGCLQEAKGVIEAMPFSGWPAIWRSFLNGCRIHGEKEVGKEGAKKSFEINKAAGYVMLSKIYFEDGLKVRKEMV
ncbi:hypothetical protein L1987_17026 [Smallanthus sonchifolius]|uniref:Uncharacterized protein n=1 Tax=Smallanthus sonchifolius TaxID=185202 RepID=A0ACB9IVN2_9ASTR|nr:hypothetical protein L1987_17026 [Smallanthus sonchifolius]